MNDFGVLPLALSPVPAPESRTAIGPTVLGGMFAATALAISRAPSS